MFDYDSAIFQPCKEWIADALNAGKSWDDILTLCVSSEERESKLADLIDEFMWPEDLTLDAWEAFVADYIVWLLSVGRSRHHQHNKLRCHAPAISA